MTSYAVITGCTAMTCETYDAKTTVARSGTTTTTISCSSISKSANDESILDATVGLIIMSIVDIDIGIIILLTYNRMRIGCRGKSGNCCNNSDRICRIITTAKTTTTTTTFTNNVAAISSNRENRS